jgi:predicted Zn finger-like uncharacterized protein
MPVRLRCPGCKTLYQLSDHARGKTIRCKGCQKTFRVPGASAVYSDNNPTKKPALQTAAAPGPAPKSARNHGLQEPPKKARVKPPPPDDEDEPVAPCPRSKKSKAPAARQRMPVALLVGLAIGGVLLVAGVVTAAIIMMGGEPAKVAQKASQAPPGSFPSPSQDQQLPNDQFQPQSPKQFKKGGKGKRPSDNPQDSQPPAEPLPVPDFEVTYSKHIQPLLSNYCGGCHNSTLRKGSANFESYATIMQGGRGKKQLLVPSEPDKSLLFREVLIGRMPPKSEGKTVTPAEKGQLRAWIEAGAKDDSGKSGAVLPETYFRLNGGDARFLTWGFAHTPPR